MKDYKEILLVAVFLCLFAAACGPTPRVYSPVDVPGWEDARAEFREPPADLPSGDRQTFEKGWSALVEDDLEQATRDLERLGRRHRHHPEVSSALGFLQLRLGDRKSAEVYFNAALVEDPALASAQAGMFLAALADGREEVALDRLRRLERDHPQHRMVDRFLSPLQLKLAESKLQAARSLKASQRYPEAAEKYREALRIAPESVGLYTETAEAELAADEPESAASHAAKALDLEPDNVHLHRLRGDALRAVGDLGGAVEAYERARSLRPEDSALALLYEQVRREQERESLPPEFFEIAEAERITREQLAALLFVKLKPALENDSSVQVIATDIGDSWAEEFIRQVVAKGFLHVFPNHTFQPYAFVRRSELADALAATIGTLAPDRADASSSRRVIEDVSSENLSYRSVSLVVSLGLLSIDEEGRFEPLRSVSGTEAVAAVEALTQKVISP